MHLFLRLSYLLKKVQIHESLQLAIEFFLEEEVLVFYDVNHFGKGIKVENRLELDVYLTKKKVLTHKDNELLVEMDNLVEAMNKGEIWQEKIRFANTKTGIVPKSALVQSLSTIFNDSKSGLYFLDKQEKKELNVKS